MPPKLIPKLELSRAQTPSTETAQSPSTESVQTPTIVLSSSVSVRPKKLKPPIAYPESKHWCGICKTNSLKGIDEHALTKTHTKNVKKCVSDAMRRNRD